MARVWVRKLGIPAGKDGIAQGIRGLTVESCQRVSAKGLDSGCVRVKIKAAAINYPDLLMTCGAYQYKPKLPYVPGTEACGIVVEVGGKVTKTKVGDRVVCYGREGMMQSYVTVQEKACRPMPNELSFREAAAFNVAYSTAYHCLVERAGLKPGDSLLVNGSTGGVGSAAVQIALAMGCRKVIATGASKKKMDLVKATLCPHHVIDFESISLDSMPAVVTGLTGGQGVDVVYDPVGGDIWTKSLQSTAYGARVCIVGWASNVQPTVRTNYILIKGLTVLGCRAGESARRGMVDREQRASALYKMVEDGLLRPTVSHAFHVSDVRKAFSAVHERQVIGKAVITFEGDGLSRSKM